MALFENGGHHLAFTSAAQPWLYKLAAAAQVNVEDAKHPCMKNLPAQFTIKNEERYTWDKSPRSNVHVLHVLASVNESSYVPNSNIKMGDHPR